MKQFIIEIRMNPDDNWKKYKSFDDLDIAKQSLETLRKHVYNLFKESEYMKYRIHDKLNNSYVYNNF